MAVVTVRSIDGMTHEITSGRHTIVADKPPNTGDDLGMDPYEILLASLGS